MKNLRRTKIICTIGPATNSPSMVKKLIKAGMNCARLNCSHGSIKERQKTFNLLDKARKEMDYPLAILLDTKGPEFRVKQFKNNYVELVEGNEFILTTKNILGDINKVSVTYKNLCKELKAKDRVLINDGLVELEVLEVKEPNIKCRVVIGGVVSNNKSMNFPGKDFDLEYLSKNDKKDLLFAIKNNIEFIACSFVSKASDIKSVRKFLDNNGGQDIYLIAKIENQSGVDNLKKICKYCNGVMVARGDLGVEVSYEKIPAIQKYIIKTCESRGKFVITSTEMLESMIENARPTRAEVSDVANAVYDGSSAIMLSGETAAGKYPIKSVKVMSKIAKSTEESINYSRLLFDRKSISKKLPKTAIARATCTMAVDLSASAIVNITQSGFTAEMISHFKPSIDVIALTSYKKEIYRLALYWGIYPKYFNFDDDKIKPKDVIDAMKEYCINYLDFVPGEKFIINAGIYTKELGYSNSIMLESV